MPIVHAINLLYAEGLFSGQYHQVQNSAIAQAEKMTEKSAVEIAPLGQDN